LIPVIWGVLSETLADEMWPKCGVDLTLGRASSEGRVGGLLTVLAMGLLGDDRRVSNCVRGEPRPAGSGGVGAGAELFRLSEIRGDDDDAGDETVNRVRRTKPLGHKHTSHGMLRDKFSIP